MSEEKINKDNKEDTRDSFWLTRIVLLRGIVFLYFVAFLVGYDQNKALIGQHGLLPANKYLGQVKAHFGEDKKFTTFMNVPTLLLFVNEKDTDFWLDLVSKCGIAISSIILITGSANMIVMFMLWVLYHTLVNVGQRWYSFGWESQLLETGFLGIFLCPLLSLERLPKYSPTPRVIIWGFRWLIFRIMIGAGLIKIRGDQCWRDLTCMNYHYQTQPVPNPLSYYLHQTPEFMHKFETLSNHFIELIAPFFILLTRKCRLFGGFIQIFFQFVLISSGNLSFLNWLTILPSIACFDDQSLSYFFSAKTMERVKSLNKERGTWTKGQYIRRVLDVGLFVLLGTLSIPVVQNLLSSHQAMNTSFDSFRIVNTYGAFGSITKTRTEVILQGTRNMTIIPDEQGGIWQEYEFKCKPGNLERRPCLISPYHYRLDWLMWFAAFMDYQQNPWLMHLTAKLLKNDGNVTQLIAYNPFEGGEPPRFIRAEHYQYEYTKMGAKTTRWWTRKRIGSYFPVVDLKMLRPFLKHYGWL